MFTHQVLRVRSQDSNPGSATEPVSFSTHTMLPGFKSTQSLKITHISYISESSLLLMYCVTYTNQTFTLTKILISDFSE